MSSIQQWAFLAMQDKEGKLSSDQSSAFQELKNRALQTGQTLAQYVEPALAVGSGMAGHLAGIAVGAGGIGMGVNAAENAYNRTQDWMTYRPRTQSGQDGLEWLGDKSQVVGDAVNKAVGQGVGAVVSAIPGQTAEAAPAIQAAITNKGVGKSVEDYITETTGSETAGTLASWVPGAVELVAGGKGIMNAAKLEMGDIGGQGIGNQRGAVGGIQQSVAEDSSGVPATMFRGDKEVRAQLGGTREEYNLDTGQFEQVPNAAWYFTPDSTVAKKYGEVGEYDIGVKNPLITDNQSLVESIRSFPEKINDLISQGYDSIYYKPTSGWGDDKPQLAIFDKQSAKLKQKDQVPGIQQSVSSGSFLDQNWQERMLTKEKYDELGLSDSTFGTTRADLTAADPDGIKSLGGVTFDTPIPAQGGPGYSDMFGLGWAAREKGGTGKLIQSEYLVPTSMTKDSHKSNATVSTAYTTALQKNIDNGWVSKETIKSSESDLSAKFPDVPTGGTPKEFNDWLDSVTFEKRSGVMSILGKSKFEGKGLPDVNRLLSQTLDKGAGGTYPTEAMTLIKNDPDSGIVKLDGKGYPTHLSYKYGTKGEVKAIFPPGMSEADLHPGDWSQYVEKSTKSGRPNPHSDAVYTFRNGWYGSKFGESIRDLLPSAADIKGGRQVNTRSFDAAISTLSDDWTTLQQGGSTAGIKDFTRAMDTNDGGATLSQVAEKDLTRMVKEGKAKIFQLGTGKKAQDIRFMIKKDSYKWADDSLPAEEWVLSSVLNNETGVRGIASEAILHKAMQEGVTALDAFDVPGAYGLPKIYGKYGFNEAKRLPFDKDMFLADAKDFYIGQNVGKNEKLTPKIKKEATAAADQRFADAENFWRSQGWDESKGYPDVVIMRKELDLDENESIKQLNAGALNNIRNESSSELTGGGSGRAPKEKHAEFRTIFEQPDSAQAVGVEGNRPTGSGPDSILPSGRRASVIDTVTSGMNYPTLKRRFSNGLQDNIASDTAIPRGTQK